MVTRFRVISNGNTQRFTLNVLNASPLLNGSLSRYKACLVANGSSQQFGWMLMRPLVCLSGHYSFSVLQFLDIGRFISLISWDVLVVRKYDYEVLEHAQVLNCNPCTTPVDTYSMLGVEGNPVSDPTLRGAFRDAPPAFKGLPEPIQYQWLGRWHWGRNLDSGPRRPKMKRSRRNSKISAPTFQAAIGLLKQLTQQGRDPIKPVNKRIENRKRVEQRCAKIDARLDALSIDFDEELYPHMLTAIAGRRWMIGAMAYDLDR
ncbi:hypothetical protein Tco_0976545 [Tanacetum coccineum]|uniref:Uncharacterized protein n=1 Tax=Tanacetum coccineum TaxID=301880 RepID=A0ABQ5EHK2_9ASTR